MTQDAALCHVLSVTFSQESRETYRRLEIATVSSAIIEHVLSRAIILTKCKLVQLNWFAFISPNMNKAFITDFITVRVYTWACKRERIGEQIDKQYCINTYRRNMSSANYTTKLTRRKKHQEKRRKKDQTITRAKNRENNLHLVTLTEILNRTFVVLSNCKNKHV